MAQMFCTLKQAAHRLETTEADIETLIHEGTLREFRDGSDRLLKVADLAALGVMAGATRGPRPARAQRSDRLPQRQRAQEPARMDNIEIRLPSTAAAGKLPGAAAPRRALRPTRRPVSPRRSVHPVAQKPVIAPRTAKPPRAVVICPPSAPHRHKPQGSEMSLRQWLWTGLLDDSPLAIFIVFGIVLLAAGGIAGGLYLLVNLL